MRSDSARWSELQYVPLTDDAGRDSDRNAPRRAAVLWALQYDRRPDDLAFLRWLVQEEATCRHEAPGNGMTEVTELAGFLLAEHRRLDDVWLQYKVKMANFDTWGMYDRHHLVAAGPRATVDFVHNSPHPDRAKILDLIMKENGEPQIADDELAEWFIGRRAYFPTDPAEEDPLTWIERATVLGMSSLARRLLDKWAREQPQDRRTLTILSYRLAEFGAYAEAADATRELLPLVGGPEYMSDLVRLAELERLADRHDSAWEALQRCGGALAIDPSWKEAGLGRSYVEQLFLLAGAAPEPLASIAFAEAHREAPTVPRLAFTTLQAAAEAATRTGHQSDSHYRDLRDAERRRIDASISREATGGT